MIPTLESIRGETVGRAAATSNLSSFVRTFGTFVCARATQKRAGELVLAQAELERLCEHRDTFSMVCPLGSTMAPAESRCCGAFQEMAPPEVAAEAVGVAMIGLAYGRSWLWRATDCHRLFRVCFSLCIRPGVTRYTGGGRSHSYSV